MMRTLCFGNEGMLLYFCSATELEKVTMSAAMRCDNSQTSHFICSLLVKIIHKTNSNLHTCLVFAGCYSNVFKETLGDVFVSQEMPEQPKPSFLKNLFSSGGSAALDRQELCKLLYIKTF